MDLQKMKQIYFLSKFSAECFMTVFCHRRSKKGFKNFKIMLFIKFYNN